MKTARQLLAEKAIDQVLSVTPQASVYQALQVLAEKNIGALLVMEEGRLVGIFSERDYARKVILLGKTSAGTPIAEIMTRKLLCVPPSATVDECMALMSEKRIRHLPVLEGETVLGILSIGDLVREIIDAQKLTIEHLEQYIHS